MKQALRVMWQDVVSIFTNRTLSLMLKSVGELIVFTLILLCVSAVIIGFTHFGQLALMWLLNLSEQIAFLTMMGIYGLMAWFTSALDR